ncbi:MAG: hypothetical protein ABI689_06790 [Thermoanaerobaculia bacterium]
MNRNLLSPKVGLSVALVLLLASASASVSAATGPAPAGAAPAVQRYALIPADQAAELPPELRAQSAALSFAEALGLTEAAGSHKVQLHWVVREGRDLSGYRLTLVAANGLPGHLAARWWVAPAAGTPLAGGLTAYSTELSLALDEPAPIAAAIEAIDLSGHAVLLGVRRSVAEVDPAPQKARAAHSEALSARPTVLQASRLAPTAPAAAANSSLYPIVAAATLAAPAMAPLPKLEPGGAVSPRGPPAEPVTA